MRLKKATTTVLAGVCFIPAIILAESARADGTVFTGDYGTLEIIDDTDFVILSAFHAAGDVINTATIEPGDENGIGFTVDSDAIIDDSLINDGVIAATKPAAATALSVNGEVGDILNDGLISASASASANSAAVAISQNRATATTTRLSNFGDVLARAIAAADGTPQAQAVAYRAQSTVQPLDLDVFNGGLIDVWAAASGEGASVISVGMFLTGPEAAGVIQNDGSVVANASAVDSGGVASAGGILVPANVVTVDIVNAGLISTYAEGETAISTGIMIVPPFTSAAGNPPSQAPLATITNDGGTIIASASTDAGASIQRGTAISTENAPNQVLIRLTGGNDGGDIFGNIHLSADDAIAVSDGSTRFDGIVNPTGVRLGSLAIADNGYFLLRNREQGVSATYVDSFTLSSDSALGLELTVDPARVPFISADLAELDGRLDVAYQPGLYSDLTTYEGVIQADQRIGAFALVHDNSALLRTEQVEDGAAIDLEVTRLRFGALPGLTQNQASAGDAIERVYGETDADTTFGRLVGDLFVLNEDEYPVALNTLAGADYAQYLQSVTWSTSQMNRIINQHTECSADATWGDVIRPVANIPIAPSQCFEPGQVSVWAQVSGSWNKQEGDGEASGYDENQEAILVGADYALSETIYAGVAAGYFDSQLKFSWFNNAIDYDGAQLAVYGGYDDSENYARSILTYGAYDGDSRRHVPSEATPNGDPDSDVVSFYGELGRRFALTPETRLTPFAGLSLAQGSIEGFTETDAEESGAALSVHGSDGNSLASALGLRLNADWSLGAVFFRPEFSVAWMHEFDDTRQSVALSFADAPDAAVFSAESAKTGRDMAVIGLRGKFALSESVDFSIMYDGRFAAHYSASAAIGRIDVKF